MPLRKNSLKPLTKSTLIPLGSTTEVSATGVSIQKKAFGSGMTALIISKEEMDDVIKIIKSLEKSSLLTKSVSKTIKKSGFLGMILGKLDAKLLGKQVKESFEQVKEQQQRVRDAKSTYPDNL